MNRRDFLGGLIKTAAAVAVLGPVVLKPTAAVAVATQEELVAAWKEQITETLINQLRECIYDELQNSNYHRMIEQGYLK